MVNTNQELKLDQKESTMQATTLQGQLNNMLTGVERSLAVTCESIMEKMKQLEEKIQDMEKKYQDLSKGTQEALKQASEPGETTESKE
mgnify:CR=1 FL=1